MNVLLIALDARQTAIITMLKFFSSFYNASYTSSGLPAETVLCISVFMYLLHVEHFDMMFHQILLSKTLYTTIAAEHSQINMNFATELELHKQSAATAALYT